MDELLDLSDTGREDPPLQIKKVRGRTTYLSSMDDSSDSSLTEMTPKRSFFSRNLNLSNDAYYNLAAIPFEIYCQTCKKEVTSDIKIE